MPDLIDDANDRAERDLERAIEVARRVTAPERNGLCLYCEAPVGPLGRFCDGDCAADFEREQRIRARQGAR